LGRGNSSWSAVAEQPGGALLLECFIDEAGKKKKNKQKQKKKPSFP